MRTLTTAVIVLGLGPGGGQVAEDLASASAEAARAIRLLGTQPQ